MPTNPYTLREVTRHAMNALNSSQITDAEINPLTTAKQLGDLFVNRAPTAQPPASPGGWGQRQDMQYHAQSILAAIGATFVTVAGVTEAVLTDAAVAAANDMNGLRDRLILVNSELTRAYQSGNRAWS